MKSKNYLWGILLIVTGVILLIDRTLNVGIFQAVNLWPIFVLAPGLIFEFSYFASGRSPGLLVPGGILTTIGLLFFFETYTGWSFSQYTWPIYPLSVSVGLFQLYLFGGRQSGLLIPVFILSAISVMSFVSIVSTVFDFTLIFAVFAILTGIYILYKTYFTKK
jgi:hypothetical protein